ncbi:MAG: glycoside hydrolase family 1 protein [Candidatus Omnitrophota bacterium]|jgi:beta-glucosidase
MIQFPRDFIWGAAAAAHQVEGDNTNSDWWDWEKKAGLKDPSGQACRHYELYRTDFGLAKSLGHNAHRLSVEWSRIEPREGEFSQKELGHYRDVIAALKEYSLTPIVTLHHFTNPLWFAKKGGWHNRKACDYFLRYVEKVVSSLSEDVKYWVTINEPMVYTYHSYILGFWPPQEKSFSKARQVKENLLLSHIKACELIRGIYERSGTGAPLISIAKNIQAFVPCVPTLRNRLAAYLRDRYFNREFIERSIAAGALDFIGVNYYTRSVVETRGWGVKNLTLDVCDGSHSRLAKNSMGWDIYPQGLYEVLMGLKRYGLPVFILENGICTDNDGFRWDFIRDHIKSMHAAMRGGVDLLGYIYWSLIDNYEWDKGFTPRFGLIEVDYNTYARTVRESAKRYSRVCATGRLE